jgi:hypothetical protein
MQSILQLPALSLGFDKVLDFFQLVSTACFEPTGVVKDKSTSSWVLKLVSDVMFPALKNPVECIIMSVEDVGRSDTDLDRRFQR